MRSFAHIAPLGPDDPAELGGYELLGRIGQGGTGQEYPGESPAGEPAAVKVIKQSLVDSETRTRFTQEVEILKTIGGTRIAALMGAAPDAERPWPATEYVEGLDLSRHLAAHGPLPAPPAAALGTTPAEALATVHGQGLPHRDLPGKALHEPSIRVYLADVLDLKVSDPAPFGRLDQGERPASPACSSLPSGIT